MACVGGVHGAAGRIADLSDIGAPFAGVFLGPENRAFTGKLVAAGLARLALRHQGVDGLELTDRCQRARAIDMADAEHGRGKQRAALAVAQLKRHAGEMRQVRIARAVDEALGANCLAARFGFHQQRADVAALHDDGAGPGVKQQLHPGGQQQLVGRAFVGRDIVGAHADSALHAVLRLIQPA